MIGVLGEFAGPEELVAGARAIRDKGYRKVEAFSPFPIHGIDDALAAPKPILPWVVFGAGMTGCIVAVLMQWYMNSFEQAFPLSGYNYGISGKPSWSLPANIPVTFELVVLFSAFTAFLGMIAFNKLPKFSNPLFRSEAFRKTTDNKFFLLVEGDDPQFATESIKSAFESIGAVYVEPVLDQPNEPMPSWIVPLGAVLTVAALIPLGLVLMNRNTIGDTPRLSIWWDMDYQPKFKAQTTAPTLFEDGRSARLPVAGTVPRGRGVIDPALELGYLPAAAEGTFETAFLQEEPPADPPAEPATEEAPATEEPAAETPAAEETPAEETPAADEAPAEEAPAEAMTEETPAEPAEETPTAEEPAAEPAAEAPAAEAPAAEAAAEPSHYNWVSEFPTAITVDSKLMERGERQYNIYCSMCHGYAGDGDGLVHKRAIERDQLATWAPPTSIHTAKLTTYPVGQLFDTISNGNISGWTQEGTPVRGRMAGYKQQISVEDRWAIVLYVKALQKTRLATPDELTETELNSLK